MTSLYFGLLLTSSHSILVPACADVCQRYKSSLTGQPVQLVAAGGMADGRSLAAALSLGASAVWVGTRFVACKESGAPQIAKDQSVSLLLLLAPCHSLTTTGS